MKTSFIKEKALELGFHLVGVAPAIRFPEAEAYLQWRKAGYAGEMRYMTTNPHIRTDCRELFPPACSVIVCGLSYHSPTAAASVSHDPLKGWISRYAWGLDYHDVLREKLNTLAAWIQQESSAPLAVKICVDTVPILERLYGKYAGLGWIGKNGCLIHQTYGSWFFLGEILLNLEIEADVPVPDRCGTCTRCVDACPTGALIAPYTLDACRCIAYLTIELNGAIPEQLRPQIGDNVFGCDRCQEICPWNRQAATPGYPEFLPLDHLYQPDLHWLCALTPEAFHRMFKNNSIKRAKLHGLLRNTAVAIGNSGLVEFIPLLEQMYARTEPLVQTHLNWAIRQLTSAQ